MGVNNANPGVPKMGVIFKARVVPANVTAALAAYVGPVTRVETRPMARALSASDRLRSGAPNAGAWLTERAGARRARRAARAAAVAAKAAAGAPF